MTASPVDGRPAPALLLAVLASLALLLLGVGDPAHASARTAAAAVTSLEADDRAADQDAAPEDADPARGSSMDGPESSLLVRAAGLAAAPAPSAPAVGVAPGSGPLVAPHLLAQPQARPPNTLRAARPAGAVGSRAPPGPEGT